MSIVKTFQNTGSVPEVAVHKFSIKIKFEVVATIRTPKQADRAWEITKSFLSPVSANTQSYDNAIVGSQ